MIKRCVLVSMYSARYSFQILIKLEFSRHIFEKYSDIKFHENSFRGNRGVLCQKTDERIHNHDVANTFFSQCIERS
jgi:hypothetical protein